ncbi:MAG TPA: c-type cytochrome [Thermodesulfobacteriota bacterium]|nr:c-type cytochrome [Thermodesulfobacteriota bacterium]
MNKKWHVKRLLWTTLIGSLFLFSLVFTDSGMAQKKKTPELLSQGKKLYERACTFCHGPLGDGKGPLAATLKTTPADFTKPLNQWTHTKGDLKKVFDVITNGVPDTAMAKFRYSEEERWALVYAVMEFSKEKGK